MYYMNQVLILQLDLKGPRLLDQMDMIHVSIAFHFYQNLKHPVCTGVTGSDMICLIQ